MGGDVGRYGRHRYNPGELIGISAVPGAKYIGYLVGGVGSIAMKGYDHFLTRLGQIGSLSYSNKQTTVS